MDEARVNTRHRRKLEKIRGEAREDSGRHSEASSGSIQATQGSSGGDAWTLQGTYGVDGSGTQGMEGGAGTHGGSDQGIRSADTEDQFAAQSTHTGHREIREGQLTTDLTDAEKIERDKELHRQRQARYAERKKQEREAVSSSETVTSRQVFTDATSATNDATNDGYVTPNDVRFQLKNPFSVKKEPEKVKLFTKSEADESVEAIAKVLMAGSSILDDILEIVVKDHVPVQIWEMDEDEATLFAQAHLKRAQKEPEAARVARKLIQIHDKLLTFKYLLSRGKATVTHIKEHGGFSFR